MTNQQSPDPTARFTCIDDYDPHSLPAVIALEHILAHIAPIEDRIWVETQMALGTVLAHPVRSPINVPPHDNAAMDGYAIRYSDIANTENRRLKVIGKSMAGAPLILNEAPPIGTCARIMTGAIIPHGFDTVIMQEHIQTDGDEIMLDPERTISAGQNVRYAGEDINQENIVLEAGTRIGAAEMGLLASIGMHRVEVYRPIKVAFFSTGDELQSIHEPLAVGEIYDSNRYTLRGMLSKLGIEFIDLGVIPDDPEALRAAFKQAAAQSDCIVSSGGVSVGEADYTKDILNELGQVSFWKIAMKPGRPLAFGQIDNTPFFGLPGNPVSVMVGFYQFVRPALKRLRGESPTEPLVFQATTQTRLKKRPGRLEYQRGILHKVEGEWVVSGTGDQGSGILTTMSRANCFIILEHDCTSIDAGEKVSVQPFVDLV